VGETWVAETDVELDGQRWAVRQSGDPRGRPLGYLHGTPSCRLEAAFADETAAQLGVRLVAFDRPGYGRSPAAPFGLASVATATGGLADRLGLDRFATLGQSGGGPFSLAGSAVLGDRVIRVGVTAGAVPYQLVPGALDLLDDTDTAAVGRLPDREAAAAGFARGFEPLRELLLRGTDEEILTMFRAGRGPRDRELMARPEIAEHLVSMMRGAMVQGTSGGAWDNVAWVGPWDFALADVRRPVHLWYGGDDHRAPEGAGSWLADHLPDATLHLAPHDGHLGVIEHVREVLGTHTAD
jgi:pimeloyl-ACP methyl ester carboxylesterase